MKLLCLLVGVGVSSIASALSVNPLSIDQSIQAFRSGDIVVSNDAKHAVNVNIIAQEALHPGMPNQKLLALGPSLSVSPMHFALKPSQKQIVHIQNHLYTTKQDRVYYFSFHSGKKNWVKVIYRARLILRPQNPEPKLVKVRHGKALTFKNTGNSNLLLLNVHQCENSHCVSYGSKRLYAGNAWVVRLKQQTSVHYETK